MTGGREPETEQDLGFTEPGPRPGQGAPSSPAQEAREAQEWHPDIRRDLVPGRSARFWGQAWRGTGIAWLPLMIVALLAAVHVDRLGSPVYLIASLTVWGLCVALFGGLHGSPLTWLEGRRERAERAAGYITTVGTEVADEGVVELDVVDPRSGRVIRLAGERMPRAFFNDRAAFMRDRLRRVRAAAAA